MKIINLIKTLCTVLIFLSSILVKSQELHTQSNPTSMTNESNALNGWTSGNITGVVESYEVFHGNYSIKFEVSSDGWKYGKYQLAATQGETYLITISAMSTSTENPEINIRGDVVNQRYARVSSNWQTFTIPVTASGPTIDMNIYPGLPSLQGNTVYVDALSITLISGTDTQAPTTPTLTSAGNTDTTVNLSFTGATDNVGVIGHMVYRDGSYLSNTDGTGAFLVQGLEANTTYTFKARAVDADGNESTDSNQISVTTNSGPDIQNPTAPTLSLVAKGENIIDLSWIGATDDMGVTNYKVYQDGALKATLGNVSFYQVSGLTAATNYDFIVTALDTAGNESANSNQVSVTTDAAAGGGSVSVWNENAGVASYSGGVAIGGNEVPSGYQLAVEGHIRTREIRVDQDVWPDYVFKDEYRLLTLEEISEHIEEYGHLPKIPSAKEVEAHGIQLGEMNRLLLEKIEELTLYILELKNEKIKVINQLKTIISDNLN
ncbi:hypothetical protein MACH07_21860 [Flagellimonas marinaquae]|uniref:Fibronectin type-III domain-containing protein n=1 Tax=Flagellimonas marinaquae TaxID=254955 RepID=A0AA48HAK7_9FLAO|nr:hypothetical protein MACH07_21860 [Allomuricauda aquimarina]